MTRGNINQLINLFNVDRLMIVLYIEGISTIMNSIITVLEYDSFSNVIYKFIVLVNPNNEEVIGVRSLVESQVFGER